MAPRLQVTRIFKKSGTGKVGLTEGVTGDIVSIAGLATTKIADTIAAPDVTVRVEPGQVRASTLQRCVTSVEAVCLDGTSRSELGMCNPVTRLPDPWLFVLSHKVHIFVPSYQV